MVIIIPVLSPVHYIICKARATTSTSLGFSV